MIFTSQQIQELLSIVDYHSSFTVANLLGKEALGDYDKFILNKHGIDVDKLRGETETSFYEMFMWGRLSAQLSNQQASQVEYEDFKKYIQRGQYIPLTKNEQQRYDISKQRSYSHLKGLGDKKKLNVNGIIIEQDLKSRKFYEKVVSEEISRGEFDRKSLTSIVSEISHKTGDWNRDWGRIVETESNNIFLQGVSETIKRDKGEDATVFKDVFAGACRFCIKFYLTDGIGSQPKLFKINELEGNGTNVGKKQADWLPVIESVHPFCRCTLRSLPNGYKWDEEKGQFSIQQIDDLKYKRTAKIKVVVGDKEFWT
ncbi:MAG: hypothetical protein OEL54_06520 [Flavobacteriaceae bacterium]|nr:hypothetical protein [Flavobacteriaceae bacterium]